MKKVHKEVDILQIQKDKLVFDVLINDSESWLIQTRSYIKAFFGETSDEYKFIERFEFYSKIKEEIQPNYAVGWTVSENIKVASRFIDYSIETLNYKGVYVLPKPNFLTHIKAEVLWAIIAASASTLGGGGFFLGNLASDKQNIELRQENKILKDSLSAIRRYRTINIEKANRKSEPLHIPSKSQSNK